MTYDYEIHYYGRRVDSLVFNLPQVVMNERDPNTRYGLKHTMDGVSRSVMHGADRPTLVDAVEDINRWHPNGPEAL